MIEQLAELAGKSGKVGDAELLLASVLQRESLCSTALPGGVAICHPRRPLPSALTGTVLSFIRTSTPVTFGAEGGEGTSIFFLLAAVDDRSHLHGLSRIARLLRSGEVLETLKSERLGDANAVVTYLRQAESAL